MNNTIKLPNGVELELLDNLTYKINRNVKIKKGNNANIKFNKSEWNKIFTKNEYYITLYQDEYDSIILYLKATNKSLQAYTVYESMFSIYDYQDHNLEKVPVAREIHQKMQTIMKYLIDNGVITNYELEDYI